MESKIRLGISSCLMGEKVRYDGGHKFDSMLVHTLGPYVEYYPVCPEVEVGFGIPREALRLIGKPEEPRMITVRSHLDVTDRMLEWSKKRVIQLEQENLCGFIFKSDSPSSGMERVKVYGESGMPVKRGIGLFARTFMEHFPLLPTEEEGRLCDARLRENFIERIFTLKRWRDMLSEANTKNGLIEFHTHHKLMILAHSPELYRQMGRLVSDLHETPLPDVQRSYEKTLMEALRIKTTVKKNINVLQHILGYFKTVLSSEEKQQILDVFDHYYKEHIPLIVPITLLGFFVRKYSEPYLAKQVYLNPHPIELQLRNHV